MNYPAGSSRRKTGNVARIVAIIFVGLGVLLGAAALVTNTLVDQSWAERSEKASGSVVDLRESFRTRSGDSPNIRERRYCPIVEYTVDGATHRLDSRVCSTSRPEIGDAVTVRYNPGNPGDAALDSWIGRWLAVVILGGMGALFLAIGVLSFVVSRAKRSATGAAGPESSRQGDFGR